MKVNTVPTINLKKTVFKILIIRLFFGLIFERLDNFDATFTDRQIHYHTISILQYTIHTARVTILYSTTELSRTGFFWC